MKKLPKVTLFRAMVGIAVIALLLAGCIQADRFYRLSRKYARVASSYRAEESAYRLSAARFRKIAEAYWKKAEEPIPAQFSRSIREKFEHGSQLNAEAAREWESLEATAWMKADRAALLREKFEHAASHPWESMPPDPRPRPPQYRGLVPPDF